MEVYPEGTPCREACTNGPLFVLSFHWLASLASLSSLRKYMRAGSLPMRSLPMCLLWTSSMAGSRNCSHNSSANTSHRGYQYHGPALSSLSSTGRMYQYSLWRWTHQSCASPSRCEVANTTVRDGMLRKYCLNASKYVWQSPRNWSISLCSPLKGAGVFMRISLIPIMVGGSAAFQVPVGP